MSQRKERSRRNPWVRIAAATAVCLALFMTLPTWALAASSDTYIPPNGSDVSGDQKYKYPGFPSYDSDAIDGPPSTDFYIIVPTIIPDHSHDTDKGKQVILKVIVTDKATRKPLSGVRVEIQDSDRRGVPAITGSREEAHMTDAKGELSIALFPSSKKQYQIAINYLGYQPYKGRPFTVAASQEMRVELVPLSMVAPVTPPAIVTTPAITPPNASITAPMKKGKVTAKRKKRYRSSSANIYATEGTGEEEPIEEPLVEEEPIEEPPPEYYPPEAYPSYGGEAEAARIHWLILGCAVVTGLAGGGRLWVIRKKLKDLESYDKQ